MLSIKGAREKGLTEKGFTERGNKYGGHVFNSEKDKRVY